uniref:CAP-Gly domain-containing protein n=1 Tax=Angiostrongylus cantonensis TaxID=6313 RepID=A0A158PA99_ANGCA
MDGDYYPLATLTPTVAVQRKPVIATLATRLFLAPSPNLAGGGVLCSLENTIGGQLDKHCYFWSTKSATMHKSHLSRTNNPTAVVTGQDIGSFVSVSGIGKGILRYVGEIRGKDGLYCGIELDAPSGKHNGTYQGVVYFVCPPLHGIFAPIYRVELDEIDDVPMMTVSQSSKAQERLTRSALPTLQLRNVFRPSSDFSTMQTSIGSEKMMDASMFSNVSWGDSDAMVCSNATFVIPPGRSHLEDSEECDLMSIPEPKSILSINRDLIGQNEDAMLGTSVVLDESRVGVENLPVVEDDDVDDDGDDGDDGDDDDLQTPLVEAPPQWQPSSCSYSQQIPSIVDTATTSTDASHVVTDHTTSKESSLRANSRQSVDTGYNDESDASRLGHEESARGQLNKSKRQSPTSEKLPVKRRREQLSKSGDNKEGGHVEKEVKSTRSRRMEKEPPPPPKFPVKPKAPSKHQLLMEQIKASIEADKLKPKKEVKARISLLPPPRAPPMQNENAIEKMLRMLHMKDFLCIHELQFSDFP